MRLTSTALTCSQKGRYENAPGSRTRDVAANGRWSSRTKSIMNAVRSEEGADTARLELLASKTSLALPRHMPIYPWTGGRGSPDYCSHSIVYCSLTLNRFPDFGE